MQERYERLINESTKMNECVICHLTPSQIYANIKNYGRAHRFVWEHLKGKIPPNIMVCHSCDNPRCINIEHLFLGTALDNMRDKVAKNRQARVGRNKLLNTEQINEAKELYEHGHTYEDIGANFGVSRRTITRAIAISSGD
jgi:uncharacterized protein YerC